MCTVVVRRSLVPGFIQCLARHPGWLLERSTGPPCLVRPANPEADAFKVVGIDQVCVHLLPL